MGRPSLCCRLPSIAPRFGANVQVERAALRLPSSRRTGVFAAAAKAQKADRISDRAWVAKIDLQSEVGQARCRSAVWGRHSVCQFWRLSSRPSAGFSLQSSGRRPEFCPGTIGGVVRPNEDPLPQKTRRSFLKASIPLEKGDKCRNSRGRLSLVARGWTEKSGELQAGKLCDAWERLKALLPGDQKR